MLSAVAPRTKEWVGGSYVRAKLPTAVPRNSFAWPGEAYPTVPANLAAPPVKRARQHKGTNATIPYARVVPTGDTKNEYEDLRRGDVAWILNIRDYKGAKAEAERSFGHAVDRTQRLASTAWVKAWTTEKKALNVDSYSLHCEGPFLTSHDEKLDSFIQDDQKWTPDGIVLSKLESPSEDPETSRFLDDRQGQLFNIGVQGPALSTTWTSDSMDKKLRCYLLDKVFICILAKFNGSSLDKFSLLPSSSSQMNNPRWINQLLQQEQVVLGAWCIGIVLDTNASRSVVGNTLLTSSRSPQLNVNVDVQWWSAKRLSQSFLSASQTTSQISKIHPFVQVLEQIMSHTDESYYRTMDRAFYTKLQRLVEGATRLWSKEEELYEKDFHDQVMNSLTPLLALTKQENVNEIMQNTLPLPSIISTILPTNYSYSYLLAFVKRTISVLELWKKSGYGKSTMPHVLFSLAIAGVALADHDITNKDVDFVGLRVNLYALIVATMPLLDNNSLQIHETAEVYSEERINQVMTNSFPPGTTWNLVDDDDPEKNDMARLLELVEKKGGPTSIAATVERHITLLKERLENITSAEAFIEETLAPLLLKTQGALDNARYEGKQPAFSVLKQPFSKFRANFYARIAATYIDAIRAEGEDNQDRIALLLGMISSCRPALVKRVVGMYDKYIQIAGTSIRSREARIETGLSQEAERARLMARNALGAFTDATRDDKRAGTFELNKALDFLEDLSIAVVELGRESMDINYITRTKALLKTSNLPLAGTVGGAHNVVKNRVLLLAKRL